MNIKCIFNLFKSNSFDNYIFLKILDKIIDFVRFIKLVLSPFALNNLFVSP